uniref:Uncharacterized protein n=1 Tax=Eutreptiella gymnastica TaxID=73025 RepID=A0A7S1I4T7_9EUGL
MSPDQPKPWNPCDMVGLAFKDNLEDLAPSPSSAKEPTIWNRRRGTLLAVEGGVTGDEASHHPSTDTSSPPSGPEQHPNAPNGDRSLLPTQATLLVMAMVGALATTESNGAATDPRSQVSSKAAGPMRGSPQTSNPAISFEAVAPMGASPETSDQALGTNTGDSLFMVCKEMSPEQTMGLGSDVGSGQSAKAEDPDPKDEEPTGCMAPCGNYNHVRAIPEVRRASDQGMDHPLPAAQLVAAPAMPESHPVGPAPTSPREPRTPGPSPRWGAIMPGSLPRVVSTSDMHNASLEHQPRWRHTLLPSPRGSLPVEPKSPTSSLMNRDRSFNRKPRFRLPVGRLWGSADSVFSLPPTPPAASSRSPPHRPGPSPSGTGLVSPPHRPGPSPRGTGPVEFSTALAGASAAAMPMASHPPVHSPKVSGLQFRLQFSSQHQLKDSPYQSLNPDSPYQSLSQSLGNQECPPEMPALHGTPAKWLQQLKSISPVRSINRGGLGG